MNEFFNIVDLSGLRDAAARGEKLQFLIVTSRGCHWCQVFKHYWAQLEERIGHVYDVSTIAVEDAGGEDLFARGSQMFLPFPVDLPMGFPTMYRVKSIDDIENIHPDIFWDSIDEEFCEDNLVSYLLAREET
jgi:hypothetical protein|tara:strand:+ start:819 stop:1214 length:396 start_codon:yes stop_codon:yes gene_type:complete